MVNHAFGRRQTDLGGTPGYLQAKALTRNVEKKREALVNALDDGPITYGEFQERYPRVQLDVFGTSYVLEHGMEFEKPESKEEYKEGDLVALRIDNGYKKKVNFAFMGTIYGVGVRHYHDFLGRVEKVEGGDVRVANDVFPHPLEVPKSDPCLRKATLTERLRVSLGLSGDLK